MNHQTKKFSYRQFFSVFLFLQFIVLVVSGFIMFLAPSGRIAYPTDWTIMGLDKDQWSDLHFILSIVFIISGVFHIIYNFACFLSYFKNRLSMSFQFKKEWLSALIIFLIISFLSISSIWPFSQLRELRDYFRQEYWMPADPNMDLGRHLNQRSLDGRYHGRNDREYQSASQQAEAKKHEEHAETPREHEHQDGEHGTERHGYGRMSLQQAMKQAGIPEETLKSRLKKAGYDHYRMDETLRKISARQGHTPGELFEIIAKND